MKIRLHIDVDDPADAPMAARKGLAYFEANPDAVLKSARTGYMSAVWETGTRKNGEPEGPPSYQLVIWGCPRSISVRVWRVFPGSKPLSRENERPTGSITYAKLG